MTAISQSAVSSLSEEMEAMQTYLVLWRFAGGGAGEDRESI